jgi:hypothetical protein
MKTRRLLIAVLAIATLVVYFVMGTDYRREGQEDEALAAQINEAALALAGIAPPPTDLAARLAAAEDELTAAQNAFPERPDSTEIIDTILKLAEASGVAAVPLVTQPWMEEFVNEEAYTVFRLNVTASGTFAELLAFLGELETSELGMLVVTGLAVARDAAAGDDGSYVNASLDIALYARASSDA